MGAIRKTSVFYASQEINKMKNAIYLHLESLG